LRSEQTCRLPFDLKDLQTRAEKREFESLGRSALAGYCTKYFRGDFALMGIGEMTEETERQVLVDLQSWVDLPLFSDPSIRSSSLVLADANLFSCDVITYNSKSHVEFSNLHPEKIRKDKEGLREPVLHSEIIRSTMSAISAFWDMGLPSDTCIMYLEDRLGELITKSQVFRELVMPSDNQRIGKVENKEKKSIADFNNIEVPLGFSAGDRKLLAAISNETHNSVLFDVVYDD